MKRTIIKAGTPGIFRPEWGQFPEPSSTVIAWFYAIEEDGPELVPVLLPAPESEEYQCYAWQYALPAPPVDGLEAFRQGWKSTMAPGYCRTVGDVEYNFNVHSERLEYYKGEDYGGKIGEFPTLAAAQEAAYDHFLFTLND